MIPSLIDTLRKKLGVLPKNAMSNLFEGEEQAEIGIKKKLDDIGERKGLNTLVGVFVPTASNVWCIFLLVLIQIHFILTDHGNSNLR